MKEKINKYKSEAVNYIDEIRPDLKLHEYNNTINGIHFEDNLISLNILRSYTIKIEDKEDVHYNLSFYIALSDKNGSVSLVTFKILPNNS